MAARNPNILVICSDQHHPMVTGYRQHPFVQTPHLDQLAAAGSCFTRAYCSSPLCTPSRMSFITGKYVHQIRSWTIGCPLDSQEMTWARRLDQAGIPSTMLGKMHFCGPYQDGGFTDYKILEDASSWPAWVVPRNVPYPDRLVGYRALRPEKRKQLLYAGRCEEPLEMPGEPDLFQLGFYNHDRQVTDWALAYLRAHGTARSRQPWALYVGLLFPHWPFRVPGKYFDLYYPDRVQMPHNARFPNPDLHPALQHFQRELNLGDVTEEMLRRTIAAYYGMITAMDDMIGELLNELEVQGFADNTYVIYTSDHGESLGEHGLFYKSCAYEGSVGVPLLVKGPDVPAGRCIDQPVSLVDMYPTIMDMAGLDTEPDRVGTSWLPLVRDEPHPRPEYAFAEYHGLFFKHAWYMLVQGDFKYVYYVPDRPSLFNLKEDPQELHDLAGDPGYAQLLAAFEQRLRTIVDPEAVAWQAKRDLGLVGPHGEDYTQTLTVAALEEGQKLGVFPAELVFLA